MITPEEVLAMVPGTELNRQVAEKVMGRKVINDSFFGYMERKGIGADSVWVVVPPYSENLAVAEMVAERMIKMGFADAVHWADFGDGKYTEPEAICKAALLAVLEEGDSEKAADKNK